MGKYHTVEQGDCLSSLAKGFGFVNFQTIYDHPENSGLKKLRPNPNIIFPGDVVYIPDRELKEVDCATEQRHSFILESSNTLFRVVLKDSDQTAFANCRYELRIDDQLFEGTTDGEGKVELKIPAQSNSGVLILFDGPGSDDDDESKMIGIFTLELGHLDPHDEVTGVQARLNNLGFSCGNVDGIVGVKTAAALCSFQKKYGLDETGELNEATRLKLRNLHDWI